jgi:hypothetical protein
MYADLRQCMPICWRSPNQIEPAATFTAFLIAVLVGAKRFAHVNWLRGDRALHALLGIDRFPTDDTIRNLFRRFTMGNVQRLFEPLMQWQMERIPVRGEGYTLDLDSTVFERYGHQEGSLKGHNPRKHGRPSHHPLLAVLAEAHLLLHGWLRSGNCGPARGVVEFLEEALALWGQRQKIRLVRADSGFFDDKLLSFLEQRRLPYIVVARLTKWIKQSCLIQDEPGARVRFSRKMSLKVRGACKLGIDHQHAGWRENRTGADPGLGVSQRGGGV